MMKRTNKQSAFSDRQEKRIQAALVYVNACDREVWVKMAMAIKSDLGEDGYDLWLDWSKSDESFNERDASSVWRSISLGGRVRIASLFHLAKQSGWCDTLPKPSGEEVAERRKMARLEAEQAEREQYQRQQLEADVAQVIWNQAEPADAKHPYLERKRIMPHSIRQVGNVLFVPMQDERGKIWNLQRIKPCGDKWFRKGRASGLFMPIGKVEGAKTLVLAEGFATGATIFEQTGLTVLCALSASNLVNVAQIIRNMRPKVDLLICGDDDRHSETNAGRTFATKAAEITGARLAFPSFEPDEIGTDFNDWLLNRMGRNDE